MLSLMWSYISFRAKAPVRRSSTLAYCVNLVKKLDFENYLCSLLLPVEIRDSAFAIRAFNVELSKVQENVIEPHILPMRYKFWEDSINGIYAGKPINHPVMIELHKAIKRHKLSKMFVKRLLAARAQQASNSTFKDMAAMETYADGTTSPIYMLLLEASGVKDMNCDHVASHLGIAQGVSNMIRGLPFNIKERLIMMPMTILMKYNVSEEKLLRYDVEASVLSELVYEIASHAYNHLRIFEYVYISH